MNTLRLELIPAKLELAQQIVDFYQRKRLAQSAKDTNAGTAMR